MKTELDKIKSTITISLGTKNRLRKLKGSNSYEEYINYLIRKSSQVMQISDNYIEVQKSKRKKGIWSFENYKILFSYNQYEYQYTFTLSQNFRFDINLDIVRKDGKKITFEKLVNNLAKEGGKTILEIEYRIYFELLKIAIQNEIEPLFKHKGRFEDYFSWKEEFKTLNLQDRCYEEDVSDMLEKYQGGTHFYD